MRSPNAWARAHPLQCRSIQAEIFKYNPDPLKEGLPKKFTGASSNTEVDPGTWPSIDTGTVPAYLQFQALNRVLRLS